jgi:hypothetical protein
MGVNNDARLVVGWQLPWHKLEPWLLAQGQRGCGAAGGACCAHPDCWDVAAVPDGWYLGAASPHYDCPCDEYCFYLSLRGLSKGIFEQTAAWNDVQAMLARPETQVAAALARDMGAREASPNTVQLVALPHVW